MSKAITVFGGNGFLGKRICQAAVSKGWSVTGLSTTGAPAKPLVPEDQRWIDEVQWRKANVFQPDSYKQYLRDADAVVHSIGILLEKVDYKKAINSSGLVNIVLGFALGNRNAGEDAAAAAQGELNTYEKTNHELAVSLAQELVNNTATAHPQFVYVSADSGFWPVIPQGYINSKRAAEYDLIELSKYVKKQRAEGWRGGNEKEKGVVESLRNVIVRPSFMFDEQDTQSVRSYLKTVMELAQYVPGVNLAVKPSVSTQSVARAVLDKLERLKEDNEIVSLDVLRSFTR